MADQDEQPSGSIEDRITHKNWKWRVSGFEELTTKYKNSFDTTGPLFNEHGPNFKKYLADVNPVVQEKVLDTLAAFVDRCDNVKSFAPSFVPVMIEKCFSTTKTKVKEKTIELLLAVIEADSPDTVIDNLMKGTTNGSLKIITSSLVVLREALKTFGPKVVQVKLIFKQYQPWFEHRDKAVREEATALMVEIYRWMKKAILPLIESLNPIQLKALNDAFDSLPDEPVVPLRYMRSEAAKAQAAAASRAAGGNGNAAAAAQQVEEIDPYSMMDPINVLNKITNEFYEGMESKKWQERQAQIDSLVDILQSAKKIENGDFQTLARVLKKTLADTNVMIVTKAIVAIGLLAEGLRTQFATHAKAFVIPIMERYKEKKPQVVPAVHATMEQILTRTLAIGDIIEDMLSILGNKVPQIKIESLNLLYKVISTTKKPQDIVKVAKQLAAALMECLNDTAEPVRDAAAKAFAALAAMLGERAVAPYFGQIDPIKVKKIKDLMPAIVVPVPQAVVVEQPVASPSAGATSKRQAQTKSSGPASSSSPSASNNNNNNLVDLAKKLSQLVPSNVLTLLESQSLKDRVEATEAILEAVASQSQQDIAELLIQYLHEKPGWKEVNFQVTNNHLSIIGALAKHDQSFTKALLPLFVNAVVDKLTDVKLKDKASETLLDVSEAVSPQAVSQAIYSFALNHKNTKVTEHALLWINVAIEEFGVNSLLFKPLFDFLKACLDSSSAAVKSTAVRVLCTLRMVFGPALMDYLSDVKRILLDLVDKEFAKVKDQRLKAHIRVSRVEDEVPRVDITPKLTTLLLANLSDTDWKQRQSALEEIERILLDANLCIQPRLGSLVNCLAKGSLTDKNQKVICTSLTLVGLLSNSIGLAFDKSAKTLLPSILALLADMKKPIRDAALTLMTQLVEVQGLDIFIIPISALLLQESATSRKEALAWLVNYLSMLRSTAELTNLIKPIIVCLQDKSAEVRVATEQLLSAICPNVPLDLFKKELARDIKPSSLPAIQAIIEKHYNSINRRPQTTTTTTTTTTTSAKTTTASKPPQFVPIAHTVAAAPSTKATTPAASASHTHTGDIVIGNPNGKLMRQKAAGTNGFYFHDTEDVMETLQEQVFSSFSEMFANMMFSANPTHQQQVVESLSALMADDDTVDFGISVLDTVFKWCSFKLFDLGVASLKRTTGLIEAIAQRLKQLDYTLNDYETGCILPVVSEKLGTSNETFKQSLRACHQPLSEVIPLNFLFKYTLDVSLRTANWRTRLESVTLLGALIGQHGAAICGNNNGLKATVSAMITTMSDRDPKSKQGAFDAMSQLYTHIGDDIWKHTAGTNLSSADRTQLQSLFANNTSVAGDMSTSTKLSESTACKSVAAAADGVDEETAKIEGYLAVLSNFGSETIDSVVEHIKLLTSSLGDQAFLEKFMYYSEEYLVAFTNILNSIISRVFDDQSIFRLYQYVIHITVTIFSNELISKHVTLNALKTLLTESIHQVVGLDRPEDPTNDWLNRALNKVILCTLQNSNNTVLFCCLLQMVTEARSQQMDNSEKYNDMLLRCLLKATKSLKTGAAAGAPIELDTTAILQAINMFLQENANLDSALKKTTTTLTLEVCNAKQSEVVDFCKNVVSSNQLSTYKNLFALLADLLGGKSAFDKLIGLKERESVASASSQAAAKPSTRVPKLADPEELNIMQLETTTTSAPKTSMAPTPSIVPVAAAPSIVAPVKTVPDPKQPNKDPRNYECSNDTEQKALLQKIFKKIGNKDHTTDGLYDLYYFKKQYSTYDITHNVQQTTEPFQKYIARSLTKIENELGQLSKQQDAAPPVSSSVGGHTYQDKLREIQNIMPNLQPGAKTELSADQRESNQRAVSRAQETLNRLKNQNKDIPSITTQTPVSMTTSSAKGPAPDLTSTVSSLRQRLQQIKDTSSSTRTTE
ncbi:hypothetical protein SAMD00019534_034980 [Acytostelium subglobosum LB1]|uniref:hypothetical protein n=1 Tax=Acytostelium subglobosum LB1 TaxID=1410327 RepID=UPI0006449091|nr:hypothetical protein SAMD00019534_034980 [Acytostelium subglobosum LB1]GAM20323.1 hypothetical protein SAMD00019534_034980 [Acytostelium subglobosum LB1]|eukprot:XP_012759844.1 hypothetical protein SAMD00019534_034980 [Acytostelium subglobosum LB1]